MANKNLVNTDQLVQIDRDHQVHPFQLFDVFRDEPNMIVAKAEGSYIWDSKIGRAHV